MYIIKSNEHSYFLLQALIIGTRILLMLLQYYHLLTVAVVAVIRREKQ